MYNYNKHNDKKLKNIVPNNPVKYFPNTYMLRGGETQLKEMLNVTIQELISEGYIDRLIEKYLPDSSYPNAVFPVSQPYEVSK